MEASQEYFVFISYSSLDNEWAIWLRHELEHYHLPASFNGRTDVRDNLRKVFRDRDELSAGPEWDEQVRKALAETNNLIVICSPNAAKSEAVNKEVETFIALGKEDHIFPFIVEGDKPEDCFPPALKHSKLGGDVNKDGGRDSAFVKIVAGMLKVGFSSLWDRYEKEKAEEERKIREQRDKLLIMQSRFLAEKALALTTADGGDSYLARRLALEALPHDVEHPDRPYTIEAELALREANLHNNAVLYHTRIVFSATFSPDGKYIVSASSDGTIRIWDVKTGKQSGELLKGHRINVPSTSTCDSPKYHVVRKKGDDVLSATFSPDGQYIVSASDDKTIRIWDAKTRKQIVEPLEGHTDTVKSATFSPDGKYIVSASDDNTVRIWDAKTGDQIGKPLEGHAGFVYSATFSPDGQYIVSASSDKTVRIWDAKIVRQISKPLEGHTGEVNSTTFTPDGKCIVLASNDKTVRIWDTKTGMQLIEPLVGHTDSVNSATFSPDGQYIVSASRDKTVRIWDIKTGKQLIEPLVGHTEAVRFATFSPDSKYIVSASWDKTVRIWDVKTGKQIGGPLVGHTEAVNSATFSPDGKYIVSASDDKTVRIWDTKTGKQIGGPLVGHTKAVNSATFSPDGKYIVLPSNDKTIRICDAKTGKQIGKPLVGHTWLVISATFSPDGNFIVSNSLDEILIWEFPSLQDLVDQTRERFMDRSLTVEERQKYYLD